VFYLFFAAVFLLLFGPYLPRYRVCYFPCTHNHYGKVNSARNRHSGLLHPGFWLLNRGGSAPPIFSSQNSEYLLQLIVQSMVVGQSWNRGQLFRHVDFEVISLLSSS
jgi:hypothetical protein